MISVCMAFYNRFDVLHKTLASYVTHYKDLDLEIVIADDGSDMPLLLPVNKDCFGPFPVKIINMPESDPLNPCVPLNKAVEASSGDRIILTNPEDEHRFPALYDMLWRHNDSKDVICAPCYDEQRGMLAGKDAVFGTPMPPNAQLHFCMLMDKSLFPGFDEDYRFGQGYEDNDFAWRLYEKGAEFTLSDVPVHHNHVKTQWNLPSNELMFYEKHPELLERPTG